PHPPGSPLFPYTTLFRSGHVDFSYDTEQILKDYSMEIPKGKIIGIHGASGSGKSTLLKLLMRFWDVQGGKISISDRDVRDINTRSEEHTSELQSRFDLVC